jgi:hypothetical protein
MVKKPKRLSRKERIKSERKSLGVRHVSGIQPTLRLKNFHLHGIAQGNTYAGEAAVIATHGYTTSDDPDFYIYQKKLNSLLESRAKSQNAVISWSGINCYLLVLHKDGDADLYLNNIPQTLNIKVKENIKVGQAIYQSQIADVTSMEIPGIKFEVTDGIIFCFRVGWKFVYYINIRTKESPLNIQKLKTELGSIYRSVFFQEIYDGLKDDELFIKVIKAGWFPFLEIIGGEFEQLQTSYKDNFNIPVEESKLISKFGEKRVLKIAERWWSNPVLKEKEIILQSALDAFLRNDPVACLKTILTEIEGVLREAYKQIGERATTDELLEFAIKCVVEKSDENSLLFPHPFLKYLQDQTFANFDPKKSESSGLTSRHTVGHGMAKPESYTMTKALQAILTFDQIVLYLSKTKI